MPSRGRRLAAAVTALVLVRLVVPLFPPAPGPWGIPFGLLLELAVAGLSTLSLWFAVRILLPEAAPAGRASTSSHPKTNNG